ncbi:YkgJ family cysteine cluster protein [bacterium]|nr:YkgJ family cysteine cluster protein [bacterium]
MASYEENYLNKRPQSLCKMCGRCCRIVSVPYKYEELKKMASEGHEGAVDFLELFEPYDSVEDVRKIDNEAVDYAIKMHKTDGIYYEGEKFYHCRFIQPDNLCGRYQDRKTLCEHYPSTPWAIVPPGCGFEGWLFWKREEIKQNVRKEKEELLELKLLKKRTKDAETLKKIELVEQKLQRNIDMYKKYGSENW